MPPEARPRGAAPIRLLEFTRSFYLGGTEGQVLELLRKLPACYRVSLAVLEPTGPMMEQVRTLGFEPPAFPLRGSVMRPNTAWQVLRLARWLKQQRIDLVHAHDFYAAVLAVPAAKLVGAKVIVGRLDLAHWHNTVQRAVLAEWTRRADHVIANAEAIRRMLVLEEQIPASRITVVLNGLDLPRFDARMADGLKAPLPDIRGPLVVHVANMNHPVKRQEDLLQALAQLRRERLRLTAFLVGDGPRRPMLEQLARTFGLVGTVHFLGHRVDVPALYARAAVGVLCSTAEGTSNAVMEGMAAGLPMVVTNVGGSPDLIRDGERGRVVRDRRPAELAEALRDVLADPGRARAMGQAGRAFVARELTLERMVARHDAVYRAVLSGQAIREEPWENTACDATERPSTAVGRPGAAGPVGDLPPP